MKKPIDPKSTKIATKKTDTAYSYARFATREQHKGTSFKRLEAAAEAYAAAHGLHLDSSLKMDDLGNSAFAKNDGGLSQFLDAVESGVVAPGSTLIVETFEGISKGPAAVKNQSVFLQIIKAGITVVTLPDGLAHNRLTISADPSGFLLSYICMVKAQEQTQMRRERAIQSRKKPTE